MATGIVSIAASARHDPLVALVLGVLAGVVFGLHTVRAAVRGRRGGGSRDPGIALPAFSIVAACAVLAVRWRTGPYGVVTCALSATAVGAWSWLVASALAAVRSRPVSQLREWAQGSWLLAVVACQSLAIAAADLAHPGTDGLLDVALAYWTLGLLGYAAVAALVIGRAVVDRGVMRGPDAWILMGALAIAALAASAMGTAGQTVAAPEWLVAVMRAAALVLWALATGWIPVLLYFQVRRLIPALYGDRSRWAAVFPLGMYSAATSALAVLLHLAGLRPVALASLWVALAAWALATVGCGVHIVVRYSFTT